MATDDELEFRPRTLSGWTDWDSFDQIKIRQATPVSRKLSGSSWHYAWGATRKFGDGWHTSVGYIFSENSVPDAHYNPLVADADRHSWSIGLGRETATWTWDVAYQLTWGTPHTVRGSASSFAGETADGRYEWWSHALSVSVGRKF